MKEIILIFRKPFPGQLSIEYLFYNISAYLKNKDTPIINRQLAYYSKGLLNRIRNVLALITYKKKIIHVTGDVHYAILGAWFCKRVLTIHDFGFMTNKTPIARFIYWLIWVYLPVKFAHKVTVVSTSTKTDMLKYVKVDETKVSVIGNFIDNIYQPVTKPARNAPPRLLQIGTAFNKNIERLLYAIEGIDCTLVIIGKLPAHIVQLLKTNRINYENKYDLSIDDLYEEYKKSDLLCYVSTLEGFGMPILEAQATGIPVVCSNCSSMPEVAGLGAFFVDPFNILSIENGIKRVLNNTTLKNDMLKQGFINVKRYSKDIIAKEYFNIYQDL
jgi:glycosyltransferase involved in cell wall biosynthesis